LYGLVTTDTVYCWLLECSLLSVPSLVNLFTR